jgi:hypothetical protein
MFVAFSIASACSQKAPGIWIDPETEGACGRCFDAQFEARRRCGSRKSPWGADGARSEYVRECLDRTRAKGSNLTRAFFDACASALNSVNECPADMIAHCEAPRGSREAYEPCTFREQCASGDCDPFFGAPRGKVRCKTCTPSVHEGGACGDSSHPCDL